MNDTVIQVENLGKRYRIGQRERYLALRDVITQAVKAPFRALARRGKNNDNTDNFIWALKDVSFEVKSGEVLGIIGRNGAGKSTLLKVLSQITEPTEGRATIRGRVASLLEVGTGFHPELTGRENIFLNGAILGMSRKEIQRKFDEIVAFSEIEKFLDTPVKRYSSGMYVRLAFAVAAHMEPEILVIDEVLAVGDAQFQKKCLGKMGDVSKEGRTVLFVSHNMAAVQQLCQSGMVLNAGKVDFLGDIGSAVNHYVQDVKTIQTVNVAERRDRQGSQWLKFTKVAIYDSEGNELQQVMSGQDVLIQLHYESEREMRNASVDVSFNVRNSQGYRLANLNSVDSGHSLLDIYSEGYFECYWPQFNLRSGSYDCNLFCCVNGEIVDWMQNAFFINVEDGDYHKTGKLIDRGQGDVLIAHSWACGPK
ncbi:MAG: ABC transporter ATP-binding protein [Deltaproteobacteria bacterium]